ncbi:IS3 family transposase [Bradyrhizobium sp. 182]|nr:IS3 family transposase [Bradyrhizobium sp. 182]
MSGSGFYAWLNRSPSGRCRSSEELGGKITASFAAYDRTYGVRRVRRDLLPDGADCGLHRIERPMRLQGLLRGHEVGACRRTAAIDSCGPYRRTCLTGSSSPSDRTRIGSPTSTISGRPRAGSM